MILFKRLLFSVFCFVAFTSNAQRGIDGNRIVNAAATIVNEYTTLTADAAIGATTISVAASGLNANVRFGAGNNLAAGDLIMIIQMQGVSCAGSTSAEFPAGSGQFYGFPNDVNWGAITSYNNCGNYEFCEVRSVPSATSITVDCGLKFGYTAAGRVQVIRVPRYNTLTITGTGVLTCPQWAAGGIFTGGVLAVEVYGATIIQPGGQINVNGLGFRGGSRVGDNVTTLGGGQVSRNNPTEGAEKGEGVYGYQNDYNLIGGGRYCRGAAGNAGGGGDAHNAGGGGGSNAGLGTWDGEGNPDVSGGAGWVSAWNLDISPTFSTHVSSGGGRGGYSFSSSNQNATTLGPKPFQSGGSNAWGGDFRINNGGWGGRPLDYSTGKIFLGGGGGAGDQENGCGGDGGNGGGLVYILSYGTLSGTGTINANGAVGGSTGSSGASFGIDGAGGAGGGGTIILNVVGGVAGITANANGGVGGNQVLLGGSEAEGPGGGGGGGYIAISSGAITNNVNGGANGTTNSGALTEFPPNGATRGAAGQNNQAISTDTINAANATICSGNTATLTANLVGSIPATITWYNAAVGGTVLGTGSTYTTPVLTTTTTYYVGFCPGTYTIPVVVTVNTSPTTSAAGPDQTVCATSATMAANTPTAGTGTWTLVSGAGTITSPSSPTTTVTALGLGANVFQWTISNPPCGTSTSTVTITSTGGPTTSNAGPNQTVCGTTATLAGNTPTTGTGTWTLVSGSGTVTTPSSPTSGITGLGVGANVFQWTISSAPCPPSSSTVTITGVAPPTTSNAGPNQTVCGTTATLAANTPTTGTGTWTLVSGSGTITTPSSPNSGVTGLGVGANVFQWTISNAPCTASTSTVTITVVAPPTTSNAGPNQTVCGTTATLAGNTPAIGTGTWTLVSGSGTITTPSSPNSGVTGLGVGANVFQWTISNAPCTASSSTVTITGVAAPTTANAGPNQTVCGTTATLAANTPTTGTGTWTLVSGSGTITTPSSPNSGVTGLGVGANVFQWTISNAPCTASSSTVTITGVAAPTTANAGPNQTVCGTTATLAANTPTTGTGTWTLVSGSGTITTPSSPNSGVTGLGVGANVFQWTISNAPCTASTSTVTITGVAPPTTSNAGPNQTVCGTTATLAGNTPAIGTGTWTLVSGSGTITTPSSPNSGVTGLGVGANVFQWTISNAPCTASSSTVTITGVAAPTTANAGPAQSVCGTTATLAGNTATTGTGTWTLVSGSGTITTPSSPTSGVTGLGIGANVFQWTIDNPPCTPSTSTVTITGVASPTTANAGPSQTVCGTTATLAGNTATIGTGNWTLVSGAGTITTPSSPTSGVTGLGVGANVFQWTISNAPCPPSTSTVTITVVPAPTASNAGPAQTVCGTTATLAGNTPTSGNGTWTLVSGAGTITTPTSPTSGITGLGIGPNVFQWTIDNPPCTPSTSTVTITGVDAPTTSNAGPNQTICGASTTLAGNTPSTGTGTWTLVSGTGLITTPSSPTTTVTGLTLGANVFQWSIDNAPCTPSTSTVTITVTAFVDATITDASPVCEGSASFNLSAVTSGGTWTGTGITSGSSGTFDPDSSGTGTFIVTYTIGGSCGSTDTSIVTVVPTTAPVITAPATACFTGGTITLSSSISGVTWSGPGITSSSAGTFDPAIAGLGSASIIITDPAACGGSDTATINVTAAADPTITPVTAVCAGSAAFNLVAATAGGVWSGSGINDTIAGTFDPASSGVGTFQVTYTISGSCGAADTTNVTVTSAANASISAVPPLCANAAPFNLSAATPGGTWSGTGITNASTGTFDPSSATAGVNVITYMIGGTCGDTATQNITVNALPTPGITSDVNSGCEPLCVNFAETASASCTSVTYDFGDGGTSGSSSPTHCFTNAGTYDVMITCTDANGCVGTTTITGMITVFPYPIAGFTAPSVSPPGTPVTFTNTSSGATTATWDFGDPGSGANNTSTLFSDSHTYSSTGTYCVLMIVSTSAGCIDSTENCIVIADTATIVIPNVFTPNGDGNNEVFYFSTTSVKELHCSIYDRWGLKIAEWTSNDDSPNGWDGRTTSGVAATDGVYYYIMNAKPYVGEEFQKTGFIQLLKEK